MTTRNLVVVEIDDPQPGIDALVEAGVLRPLGTLGIGIDGYVVAQPHAHEWRVRHFTAVNPDELVAACACGEMRSVDPRLPIEVPE